MRPAPWSVFVLLALAAPLRAEEEPVTFPGFAPSGLYVLQLDGVLLEDATLYRSQTSAAFLVLAPDLADGVLVLPRRVCVERVHAGEVRRHEDGTIDVVKAQVPCSLGPYRLEGADVAFEVEGKPARLRPTPPLMGVHPAKTLLRHTPEYARAAQAYQPDAALLAKLRSKPHAARVEVFFGSWCTFCTRFLPGVLRVEQELAGTGIEFVYHGLPAPPAAWVTPEAVQLGIKKLITGIVFVDGKEVARIVGNGWILPEKALLENVP